MQGSNIEPYPLNSMPYITLETSKPASNKYQLKHINILGYQREKTEVPSFHWTCPQTFSFPRPTIHPRRAALPARSSAADLRARFPQTSWDSTALPGCLLCPLNHCYSEMKTITGRILVVHLTAYMTASMRTIANGAVREYMDRAYYLKTKLIFIHEESI